MITIIDYDIGNIGSVANACKKLEVPFQISNDPALIQKARTLILPGVGAAGKGMQNLKDRNLDKIIIQKIKDGIPFLGICLGMQLLFEESAEGNTQCLGVLKGKVKKFKKERKIPQIGWNKVSFKNDDLRFKNIPNNSYFYFVNSYYCLPSDNSIVYGLTEYGERFASIIVKKNIFATQFHPEKSGKIGFQLLKNFIKNIC